MNGRRRRTVATVVLLGVVFATPALAQGADCFSFGYGLDNLDADDAVSLGRINDTSPRVNFVKREVLQKGCPSSAAACRDKSYLVPGDEVVISGGSGDFICASYAGRKGAVTDGWLPRAAISSISPLPDGQAESWIGQWQSGPEQTIVIEGKAGQDALKITGDASWGALDPGRVARGAVNIGSLEGDATIREGKLSFAMGENGTLPFDQGDEYDCKVQMRRLGSYLLVKDNTMCGGHNVTFTGIYRRR